MPSRDLSIRWQPISLLNKNEPSPDSDRFKRYEQTHNYLRVMEAVRASAIADGGAEPASTRNGDGPVSDPVYRLYWEYGRRIHHDGELYFDPADALASAGLDPSFAGAFDDDSWDGPIKERMSDGLALTGDDVGTPIIAFQPEGGERVGLFGPVITRVPTTEQSLQLWDGFMAMASVPGFWEVKRTRTERPEFGDRP